ncbi:hypothetical protein VOLCADRAFT_98457 [Volvox carteri f. nagariensis]|uniref:Pherophorin domain-containing protein n=1 Tax=Volvox carteri f. nagariensis TaxID=3068 RepID=D8UFD9_VOLCA|nr:uncharacterized protein VOLCADRAFT_98457 [Volvox carteri f. nagariensis]EFJ41592.1 hypothetical protein VOLCADRAFT_98457 [Volvox carteri f. nagariensis]|eukprot:XP_002957383.1 hypothetical protein VOLCADRAFT_98457 [Volvox carteri f. nagariensis]
MNAHTLLNFTATHNFCHAVFLLAEYKHIVSARIISLRGGQELRTSLTGLTTSDCGCSPYSLGFASFEKRFLGGGQRDSRYCFLVGVRGCDPGDTCCETLLRGGVDSLYLQTSGAYDSRVTAVHSRGHKHVEMGVRQVEVNGSIWMRWDAAPQRTDGGTLPAGMDDIDAATIRIFGLSLDSSTFSGTTICLTTTSVADMEQGSLVGEQLLCEAPGDCRFAVTPAAAAGGAKDAEKDAAPPSPSLGSKTSDAAMISYSQVCAAINLISPRDQSGALTYTFGKQVSCDGAAEWMAKNLTDAAQQAGAQISTPFALESCSATYDPNVKPPAVPYVMVCGSFANVKEAAKIQGLLSPILLQWSYLVLGRKLPEGAGSLPYMCPPLGYTIQTMVWGTEDESPVAFSQVCSWDLAGSSPSGFAF